MFACLLAELHYKAVNSMDICMNSLRYTMFRSSLYRIQSKDERQQSYFVCFLVDS